MKLLLLLGFYILFNYQVSAIDCFKYSKKDIKSEIGLLLGLDEFESLRNINLKIKSTNSRSYYFATGITKVLKNSKNRIYIIKVSPVVYNCGPSPRALKAILAHELFHIVDYVQMSGAHLVKFGLNYLLSSAKIERYTDLRVLKMGMTNGISEYRLWLYPKLSPKALKTKKKRYFTPIEIEEAVNNGAFDPLD